MSSKLPAVKTAAELSEDRAETEENYTCADRRKSEFTARKDTDRP